MQNSKNKDTELISQTLAEHLVSLKNTLLKSAIFFIFAFAFSYYFIDEIYKFILQPLANVYSNKGSEGRLIYTNLTEAFFTYIKLSVYSALFISTPFWLYQIYLFILPGLYKEERKGLKWLFISCPLLFLLGACFVYYMVFPMAWKFFLGFENTFEFAQNEIPIQLEARISEYLSLVIHLIFAFGIAFQLPVVLILLLKLKIISVESLKKNRKYFLIFVAIISAVLTPPDIISQILLIIPLMCLYEISVILGRKISTKETRNP